MEDSSTDSDFERECEKLVESFGIFELTDDDTVQTSTGSARNSDFSSSVSLRVAIPLYPENMWTVHSSSGRSNPPQGANASSNSQSPFASQATPVEHSAENYMFLLAQDQQGSQYLQEQLISADFRMQAKIFWTVYRFTFELMNHQYGRFVFGKLIESCDEYQLALITLKVTIKEKLLLRASIDHFGSSSIKKLIKVLEKSQWLDPVLSALKRFFRFMMITKPGSSVILQCLETLSNHQNDMIYQAALEHGLYLACHTKGCIYFNNFIDGMRGSRRNQILNLISTNAASLSKNPWGNYVVQHILNLEDPGLVETICFVLRGHYTDISLTKCGSFIVQKCLQHQNTLHYIVEDFLKSDQIFQVASDQYGNYVIQTALEKTMKPNTPDLHRRLVSKLQQHLGALQKMKYGRNVYTIVRASLPGTLSM